MTVQSVTDYYLSSSVGDTSSTSDDQEDSLGRDDFLTLLVAQLQNQDPLNPLESQDFTAQMAQFSSLEQLFDVNESLLNIQEALTESQKENVLDYIGMEIKAAGNTLYKDGDNLDQGSYYIESDAEVVVTIYDDTGLEIRRIDAGYLESGEHDLSWDGRDEDGNEMADGIYTYEISAEDEDGSDVYSITYSKGEVTGVSTQYGETYLIVGERLLEPDNVLEASQITDN